MKNLTELVLDRAERRPDARFGMAGTPLTLGTAVELAVDGAAKLLAAGIEPDSRVALVGSTSNSYLTTWLSAVFAGVAPALINPTYPDALLGEMLRDLAPTAVLWSDRDVTPQVAPHVTHVDTTRLDTGVVLSAGEAVGGGRGQGLPGLVAGPGDPASYMHTSGTTGVPKFCEQTHHYFLSLGRFVADTLCLSPADTVFAPLPMFHINPLGYGVVGALTGGADVLGTPRFSASSFWPLVRDHGVTVLFLHAPPVEILKRATTTADADGHQVTRVFFADDEFLETFDVPLGFSGYGSTEAGGLSHLRAWRQGDQVSGPEGVSRVGGQARHDLEWAVVDGEILVRGRRPGVLFSGYRKGDTLDDRLDDAGWFHTGDLGRVDSDGHLVFIERAAESIRVKGEYVPIGYVEQRFAALAGLRDVAVWRRPSELIDDELVLFVVADELPHEAITSVSTSLPAFMRPAVVARMPALPRDSGVGKVRRHELEISQALDVWTPISPGAVPSAGTNDCQSTSPAPPSPVKSDADEETPRP